jgi:hypothetical protein
VAAAAAARPAYRHPGRGCGRQVDRGVRYHGGDQQLQLRQQPEPLGRERGPLPHRDDDVKARQLRGQVRGVGDVPVEGPDLPRAERGPVGAGQRGVLVIVEDGDAHGRGS